MPIQELPKRNEYWVNHKHQTRYRVFNLGMDATNDRAGTQVVIYYGPDRVLCVREVQEFLQKFRKE
jgi:hypothetical protein